MFLSALLTEAGFPPDRIRAKAAVHLGQMNGAPTITLIELTIEAQVPRLGESVFQEKAAAAKVGCPVSKALAATEIRLTAKLLS